jgi:hypothetical protein
MECRYPGRVLFFAAGTWVLPVFCLRRHEDFAAKLRFARHSGMPAHTQTADQGQAPSAK